MEKIGAAMGKFSKDALQNELWKALDKGSAKALQKALAAGADPSRAEYFPYYDGHAPLMFAARMGNQELASILLDAGADALAADGWGRTALYFAAEDGRAGLVGLLLPHSDLHKAVDKRGSFLAGRDALCAALSNGSLSCFRAMAPLADWSRISRKALGESLRGAVEGSSGDVVRLVGPMVGEEALENCVWEAASRNGKEALEALIGLLGRERALEMSTPEGYTPLMAAARYGHLDAIGVLLPASDLAARDKTGQTALDYAGHSAQSAQARWLIESFGPKMEALELSGAAGPGQGKTGLRI